jgi:hypothetical protein
MTRADLLTYLAATFTVLGAEAQVSLTDTAAGLAYPLDSAMTALGSDTGNTEAGHALGEYYSLLKFRYAVAGRVDFDATAVRKGRSQIYEQIDALIKDAQQRAAATGHPTTAGNNLTSINLDYIEPDLEIAYTP